MATNDAEKSEKVRKPSIFLFIAAFSALLGGAVMGTVLGWTSQAVPDMSRNDSKPQLTNEDNQTKAWVASSATLGALAGALASGPIAQILGRKMAIIIYGVPAIAGFGCLWLATNTATLIIGRILTGLAAGLISGTAPTYVVEISTERIRGMLGTGFQLSVTIGILCSYVFGAFMSWNWLSFVCLIPATLMVVLMIFMPETPIWLMTKSGGDYSKGSKVEKTLKSLRDPSSDNESELAEIAESAKGSQNSGVISMADTKNPLFYKPFTLSVLLMIFQQFSGINAVMFNATIILKESGSTIEDKYGAIIIGVAQVIATVVGALLVDRLGRKKLLIGSAIGHAFSLGLLGLYYIVEMEAGWLPVVCLVIFIISFSLGWGPIPWLMIAEITPMQFRSMVSAVATAVNWICAFLITHNFATLQHLTSKEFSFFFFAFFCIISVPFVAMFLPETKGKSFEEILRHFSTNKISSEPNTPSASNTMLKEGNKPNDAGANGADNKMEMQALKAQK